MKKRTYVRKKRSFNLMIRVWFVLGLIGIILFTLAVFWIFSAIFIETDVLGGDETGWLMAIATISSFAIGSVIATIYIRSVLQPVEKLVDGMSRLSAGDYSVRVDLGKSAAAKELSDSFNHLAKELSNTEMLRSDFINNFSHEFKTPVASISGLLELLKKDKVSAAKRKEYISIIDEETQRLLTMSTNVLNLSKVENQTALKDVEVFNLSEQVRTCIVLLSKRWERKNLSLALEFPEYEMRGNADMLVQVWTNLIDNAIKFADEGSELKIDIEDLDTALKVSVTNTGVPIRDEDKEKLFQKFYQADSTHVREGNGIGLSIVRRIVELHKGSVSFESKEGVTTFFVTLPKGRPEA